MSQTSELTYCVNQDCTHLHKRAPQLETEHSIVQATLPKLYTHQFCLSSFTWKKLMHAGKLHRMLFTLPFQVILYDEDPPAASVCDRAIV